MVSSPNACRWLIAIFLCLPATLCGDEPENLKAAAPVPPLIVKVYAVADLVVPTPGSTDNEPHYDSLIQLIQNQIDPESWQDKKHGGSLIPAEKTLSLVIRQTEENHQKIERLLNGIRGLQDIQVTTEFRIVRIRNDKFWERFRPTQPYSEDQMRLLMDRLQSDTHANILFAPKLTTFDGQSADLHTVFPIGELKGITLRTTVSEDRRTLNTVCCFRSEEEETEDALERSLGFTLADGETLVIPLEAHLWKSGSNRLLDPEFLRSRGVDVTPPPHPEAPGRREFLLITQRVIVAEQEEELLSTR
ncbi:MAG: hypothetical protein KDA80_16760 [Planctomycetaceae bacterium]|nr:hypothetical protein [Planctomycetaceae bacterium]